MLLFSNTNILISYRNTACSWILANWFVGFTQACFFLEKLFIPNKGWISVYVCPNQKASITEGVGQRSILIDVEVGLPSIGLMNLSLLL